MAPVARRRLTALSLAIAAFACCTALADVYSEALTRAGRPPEDHKRDLIDHPAEVLRLSGIRSGMQVADFLAADGYYSELLSTIVGPKGHVYLLNNEAYEKWSENGWQKRMSRLPNVTHQTIVVEHTGLPARSLDAVLLIKVYHDFYWQADKGPWPKVDPDATLTEIARVMRPGGILLLVDHSAKPGTGSADAGSLHRIDAAYARRDFEKHGFLFVKSSDLLARPDDARDKITYEGEIVGKTDRFVMVFKRAG